MRKIVLTWTLILVSHVAFCQKQPLDHSVYDRWESIGERSLSPDGKYLVYSVTPQEGDARLYIRGTESDYAKEIPRGANATFSDDSRFVVFHIKPFFKDSREARIKKKTPDQSPKDTLAWVELGKDSLVKIPRAADSLRGRIATIGASLWQHPELYIKNSPLFRADKVTTPLLMMHNDADGSVPRYQGIEYFSALRRLGKKTWLIEYNGEDHGLTERRNRKDWSIRLGQFFGYYLKGEAPPRWITEGVPATLKGIDWGLGTDQGLPEQFR